MRERRELARSAFAKHLELCQRLHQTSIEHVAVVTLGSIEEADSAVFDAESDAIPIGADRASIAPRKFGHLTSLCCKSRAEHLHLDAPLRFDFERHQRAAAALALSGTRRHTPLESRALQRELTPPLAALSVPLRHHDVARYRSAHTNLLTVRVVTDALSRRRHVRQRELSPGGHQRTCSSPPSANSASMCKSPA
jgi:hypothetical protein